MSNNYESDEHENLRENIQDELNNLGIDFRHSHGDNSNGGGPTIYISNPNYGDNTKTGCRVSEPDIFIKHDKGIDIIEIERVSEDEKGKTPKYLLGDVFSVHKSNFYRNKNGEVKCFEGVCRLFIILTKTKPIKGKKFEQYEHLIESLNFDKGTLDYADILWKDEIDSLINEIAKNQKI